MMFNFRSCIFVPDTFNSNSYALDSSRMSLILASNTFSPVAKRYGGI